MKKFRFAYAVGLYAVAAVMRGEEATPAMEPPVVLRESVTTVAPYKEPQRAFLRPVVGGRIEFSTGLPTSAWKRTRIFRWVGTPRGAKYRPATKTSLDFESLAAGGRTKSTLK